MIILLVAGELSKLTKQLIFKVQSSKVETDLFISIKLKKSDNFLISL